MGIKFYDDVHKETYYGLLRRMKSDDTYHQVVAYLFALDPVCAAHVSNLYDFDQDCIIPEGVVCGWQTDTSRKTTRLAFNLFTQSLCWADEDMIHYCTPADLFDCEYIIYYLQAVKLLYASYVELTVKIHSRR